MRRYAAACHSCQEKIRILPKSPKATTYQRDSRTRASRERTSVVVPAEQTQVSEFSWTNEVSRSEDEAQKHAKRCYSDVRSSKEEISTSYPGHRAEYDRLGAVEHGYRVV